MKGIIQQAKYISNPENYSELKVLKSNAGYYIGTTYKDPITQKESPGSRDTDYFDSKELAEAALYLLETNDPLAPELRTMP
jgi:hypothetical protein